MALQKRKGRTDLVLPWPKSIWPWSCRFPITPLPAPAAPGETGTEQALLSGNAGYGKLKLHSGFFSGMDRDALRRANRLTIANDLALKRVVVVPARLQIRRREDPGARSRSGN